RLPLASAIGSTSPQSLRPPPGVTGAPQVVSAVQKLAEQLLDLGQLGHDRVELGISHAGACPNPAGLSLPVLDRLTEYFPPGGAPGAVLVYGDRKVKVTAQLHEPIAGVPGALVDGERAYHRAAVLHLVAVDVPECRDQAGVAGR